MTDTTNIKRVEIEPKPSSIVGVLYVLAAIGAYLAATSIAFMAINRSATDMSLLVIMAVFYAFCGTWALYRFQKWNEQRQIPDDLRNAFLGDN